MNVFRAYDIRGEVPAELNLELVSRIGKSYCRFLKPKRIVVGYDARESSPKLYKALVKGIRSQGVDIISIGLSTTPMFYFSLNHFKVDGGIMITSSHSPLNTNGLKLCGKNAGSIHVGNGLKKIKEMAEKNIKTKKKGKLKNKSIFREYYKFIKKHSKRSKLRIGVDGSNMSGVIDYKILKRLYKVKGININLNRKKPYFHPNPLIESNLKSIKELIKKNKLDMGVVFDGDCDRVTFLDEKGKVVYSDIIAAILIDRYKYKKVLKEESSSKIIKEVCKRNNIKLLKTKIGHSLVDSKLKYTKSDFASERTGHFYYRDFFCKDNGLLTVVKLVNVLDETLSITSKPYKRYFHSGEINFKTKNKDEIIKKVKNTYKKNKMSTFDGLKIISKDYWIYLRKSNTQKLLRLYIETEKKEKLNEIKKKITKIIRTIG